MTDSSIIQQARDVLAKWREEARKGRWHFAFVNNGLVTIDGDMERNEFEIASPVSKQDARLIVGVAGNPDLLDALDDGLRQYGTMPERSVPTFIKCIAGAIIAADERMSA